MKDLVDMLHCVWPPIISPDTGMPWMPPEVIEKEKRRRQQPYEQPSLPLYVPEMPHNPKRETEEDRGVCIIDVGDDERQDYI